MKETTKKNDLTIDVNSLTFDQLNKLVQENAEGLSNKHNCKVFGFITNTDKTGEDKGEWVVAYYKEASFFDKMSILDVSMESGSSKVLKGWKLFEKNVIKENSDMKYFDKKDPKNSGIINGVSIDVFTNSVDLCVNRATELKKNG